MLSFSLRWILAVPGWFAARSVALEGRPDDGRGLALRMLAVVPRRPRLLPVPGVSVCACPCSALAGVLLVPPLVVPRRDVGSDAFNLAGLASAVDARPGGRSLHTAPAREIQGPTVAARPVAALCGCCAVFPGPRATH